MKKNLLIVAVVAALVLSFALAGILTACGNDETPKEPVTPEPPAHVKNVYKVGYENLEADDYQNYAETVFLNTKKYPELERQGLRIVTGYDVDDYANANEATLDTVEAALNYFNPNKGILVIINGLQIGIGYQHNANMQSDSRLKELDRHPEAEDIEYFTKDPNSIQTYDLGKYWMDNGYNVFYFHWEMFADHPNAVEAPDAINDRIWTRDTGVQARYYRDGKSLLTEPNQAILGGSVAELFAAQYARMANAVKQAYPNYAATDVRFAGHSMGGVLTVASSALVQLIADDGQLDQTFVPNRLALMDSYLGIGMLSDLTISWSGKPYAVGEGRDSTCNYLAALNMLVNKYGVAAEFCCNEGFLVPFMNMVGLTDLSYDEEYCEFVGKNKSEFANAVNELAPIIVISPYFSAVSGGVAAEGHNPIREWYLSSILYDAPTTEDGYIVPTAKMSDEGVRAARGDYYVMRNAHESYCETVRCDDDTFVRNLAK